MIRKLALLLACAAFAPNASAQEILNGRYSLTLTTGGMACWNWSRRAKP
jgi:hypothetical protein